MKKKIAKSKDERAKTKPPIGPCRPIIKKKKKNGTLQNQTV